MTDNNRERTIRDILNDEVERQLTENPPAKPSFDEFKAMAYERIANKDGETDDNFEEAEHRGVAEVKGKRRRRRVAGIAAGFALVLLMGGIAMNSLHTDVGANKNPKETKVTEHGIIIEDKGWGSSEGPDNIWVIDEWHDVADVRKTIPELLIPEYVPKGYVFDKLVVETLASHGKSCRYFFKNEKKSFEVDVFIYNSALSSINLGKNREAIETVKGTVYVTDEGEFKIATIYIYDGITVDVWYSFSDDELVKVVEALDG